MVPKNSTIHSFIHGAQASENARTNLQSGNIPWKDIESLFKALGAEVSERTGSRVAVVYSMKSVYFTGHTPHRILIKER